MRIIIAPTYMISHDLSYRACVVSTKHQHHRMMIIIARICSIRRTAATDSYMLMQHSIHTVTISGFAITRGMACYGNMLCGHAMPYVLAWHGMSLSHIITCHMYNRRPCCLVPKCS